MPEGETLKPQDDHCRPAGDEDLTLPQLDRHDLLYTSLNVNCQEFRLLRANPNTTEDLLSYELAVVTPDLAPQYFAISYTWGSSEKCATISCNGKSLSITRSLHQVLTRAAVLSRAYFWVDAICINQDDLEERSHQVQRMWNIFNSAFKVIGFIGEAPHDEAVAVQNHVTRQFQGCTSWEDFSQQCQDPDFDVHPRNSVVTSALMRFQSMPWWSRCWIVQEILAACDIDLWYGDASFSMIELYHALFLETDTKETDFKAMQRKDFVASELSRKDDAGSIPSPRRHAAFVVQTWVTWKSSPEKDFLSLMTKFATRDASNKKDKLYSLLGLATQADREAFVPEYSPSYNASQLFLDFAKHIIKADSDPMRILLLASRPYDSKSKQPAHLAQSIDQLCDSLQEIVPRIDRPRKPKPKPSWVPQWEYSDRIILPASIYACSGRTRAVMEVIPDKIAQEASESNVFRPDTKSLYARLYPPALRVRGAILGRLTYAISSHPIDHEELPGFGAFTDDKFLSLLARLLICDATRLPSLGLTREVVERDVKTALHFQVRELWPDWHRDNPERTTSARFYEELAKMMKTQFNIRNMQCGRELGIVKSTERSYWGTFPIEASPSHELGDVVALLFGSRVPFVLRPNRMPFDTDRAIDAERNYFRAYRSWELIGECYVDGIMDGELVDMDERGEVTVKGSSVTDLLIL